MKNNYKQLSASPTGTFRRSTSHALRSSFRISTKNKNKRMSGQFNALNLDQLPSHVPPKALKLLQIDLPSLNKVEKSIDGSELPVKIAMIRKKSVWANASTSKLSLFANCIHLKIKNQGELFQLNKFIHMNAVGFFVILVKILNHVLITTTCSD